MCVRIEARHWPWEATAAKSNRVGLGGCHSFGPQSCPESPSLGFVRSLWTGVQHPHTKIPHQLTCGLRPPNQLSRESKTRVWRSTGNCSTSSRFHDFGPVEPTRCVTTRGSSRSRRAELPAVGTAQCGSRLPPLNAMLKSLITLTPCFNTVDTWTHCYPLMTKSQAPRVHLLHAPSAVYSWPPSP